MTAAEWLASDAVTEALAKIKAANEAEERLEQAKATPVVQTDVLTYVCAACGEFGVLVELQMEGPAAGQWSVVHDERCPTCGAIGKDLTEEDPDAYWQADERCGEDEEESDGRDSEALTAWERNR